MARFGAERREVRVDGGTFAYLEAGEVGAQVALCLHGFPDHPRTFEPIAGPLLEAGYRVVAPWLRGYRPSVAHGPYAPERLGRDAAELAGALAGDGKVLLVGHDWGAIAGWYAAARFPERFAALVALSVPHPRAFLRNLPRHPKQWLRSWYVGFFQLPGLPERLLAFQGFASVDRLYRMSSVPRGRPLPYLADLVATLRESGSGPFGPYRALPQHRRASRRELRIGVPTLFLAGARDPSVGPELARGQEREIDAVYEGHVFPGAGHFLHHDRPTEVAETILRFVRAVNRQDEAPRSPGASTAGDRG